MSFHKGVSGPPIGPSGNTRKLISTQAASTIRTGLHYLKSYFWTTSSDRCAKTSASAPKSIRHGTAIRSRDGRAGGEAVEGTVGSIIIFMM